MIHKDSPGISEHFRTPGFANFQLLVSLKSGDGPASAEPNHKTARQKQQGRAYDELVPSASTEKCQDHDEADLQEEGHYPAARSGKEKSADGHER